MSGPIDDLTDFIHDVGYYALAWAIAGLVIGIVVSVIILG
jgi:hypothetical protein